MQINNIFISGTSHIGSIFQASIMSVLHTPKFALTEIVFHLSKVKSICNSVVLRLRSKASGFKAREKYSEFDIFVDSSS